MLISLKRIVRKKKIIWTTLFIVFQSCSGNSFFGGTGSADRAAKKPTDGSLSREPRTIGAAEEATTTISGSIDMPASLVQQSMAGIRVFIDGNAEMSDETDANGDFEIGLPASFIAASQQDGNVSVGIVAEIEIGGQRHGFRQQIRNITLGEKRLSGRVQAQRFGMIVGHVGVLEDGKLMPLTDANVFIARSKFSVRTDGEGAFSIELPHGEWRLQAERQGYVLAYQRYQVHAGQKLLKVRLLLMPIGDSLIGKAQLNEGRKQTDSKRVTIKLFYDRRVRGMRITQAKDQGKWEAAKTEVVRDLVSDGNSMMTVYVTFSDDVGGAGKTVDGGTYRIQYAPAIAQKEAHYAAIDDAAQVVLDAKTNYFNAKTVAARLLKVGKEIKPAAMTIGDFNKDGFIDIVVVSANEEPNVLFLSQGQDSSRQRIPFAVADKRQAHSVACGDFDGDGVDDIVVGFDDAHTRIYFGGGETIFSRTHDLVSLQDTDSGSEGGFVTSLVSGSEFGSTRVVAADLDHRGQPEIIVAYDGYIPEYYRYDGKGRFTVTLIGTLPLSPNVITVAWLENTTMQAIFMANDEKGVVGFSNDGNGYKVLFKPTRDPVRDLVSGDLNGDGRQDLAFVTKAETNFNGGFLFKKEGASFGPQVPLPFSRDETHATLVRKLNIDGDAKDELLLGNGQGELTLQFFHDGVAAMPISFGGNGYETIDIAVVDINNDSFLDVIELFEYSTDSESVDPAHKLRIIMGKAPE